jgi:MSHA biogenesis protein MshE
MPRPEKVRLGEILLQQQLLTEQQLQEALTEQKRSGRKLGRVFVEKGFVSRSRSPGAAAQQ